MAADRDRPDAPSLRALAMDPLDAYEEYEALWETAATPTVEERSGWRALIATLDGGVPGDVREKCGYRVWTARDEDSWREETYAPWLSSPWELHTVDGEPPDEKTLNAYEKDKRKAAKREAKERRRAVRKGEDSDASRGFHPLAVLGMLPVSEPDVVMAAAGGARFFGFRADPTAEDQARRGVQTTVGVSRDGRLESVDQRSTEAFTGGRGVKIERIHTRVIFGLDSVLGLPSIRYYEMAFEARAFRVVKVRNHTTRWYSDIRCPEWEQLVGSGERG